MKNLLEVVNILTRKKIAKIEILDEQTLKNKDSKFGILYEALMTGKIKNDEDAARILYGSPDTGDAKYRQLKFRFKRRLYNTLFFADINAPLASNRAQAHFTSNKDWALVEIMLAYETHIAATTQARQILTTALKYHFTDLIVKCARLLREHAALDEDEKNFEQYTAIVEMYTPILKAETEAEELSFKALLAYKTQPVQEKQKQTLEAIGNELIALGQKIDSPTIQYHEFIVWVLYYETMREFDDLLELCLRAEAYINSQPDYFDNNKKAFFLTKRLSVYLHLQQYREGETLAEAILQELPTDSLEWLDFMEYYLLLLLHAENYYKALAVFNNVADSPAFKKLEGIRQEKWGLFEAFLNYFVESRAISPSFLHRQRRKVFKINNFINTPVSYPANLATIALHKLTLQILFQLERHNYTGLSKNIEQLGKLSSYEFKKKGYERANAFTKLLYYLGKAEFELDAMRHREKYLKQLNAQAFFYRGKIAELEVLLYEKLWEELCRHLA